MKKYLRILLSLLLVCSFLPVNIPLRKMAAETTGTAGATPYIDGIYGYTDGDGSTVDHLAVFVGGKGDLSPFDFGLMYDSDEVEVEKVEWVDLFKIPYKNAGGVMACNAMPSPRDYVVFGGATSDSFSWNEVVGKVYFKVKEGVQTAHFSVCKDTSTYDTAGALRDVATVCDEKSFDVANAIPGPIPEPAEPTTTPSASAEPSPAASAQPTTPATSAQPTQSAQPAPSVNPTPGTGSDENEGKSVYIADVSYQDGKILVDVATDTDLSAFAIGLMYNHNEVACTSVEWNANFKSDYYRSGVLAKVDQGSPGDYVALGGATDADSFVWKGTIARVEFTPKEGVEAATFSICEDMDADYLKNYAPSQGPLRDVAQVSDQRTIEISSTTFGDVDGDGFATLEDVRLVHKAALNLIRLNEEQIKNVDMDDDGKITLKEVQMLLKYVMLEVVRDKGGAPIGTDADIPTPEAVLIPQSDGTYVLDVSVKKVPFEKFNYCFEYLKEDWEVVNTECENVNGYLQSGDAMVRLFECESDSSYGEVRYGLVYALDDEFYTGPLFHVTLRPKNNNPSAITLYKNCVNPTKVLTVEAPKSEIIQNPDGTTTEKKTENTIEADGTTKNTVTEVTTATDGAVIEKKTEVAEKTDGSREEVTSEKKTNTDGSIEERIEKLIRENERLTKIVEKLLQMTEELYNRYVKKEQENTDGSKNIKEVSESAVEVDGEILKKSVTADEKLDADGRRVERFSYDTEVLGDNVEWDTQKKEEVEDAYKDKVETDKTLGAVTYDITPKVEDKPVQVSGGSVEVTLLYGDRAKKNSRFRVYDCEQNKWIDAHYENGYVAFDAQHFSKYIVAEVQGWKYGDINKNESVDLKDAQTALKIALKIIKDPTPEEVELGDVVGNDGKITLKDAQAILKKALRIPVVFDKED